MRRLPILLTLAWFLVASTACQRSGHSAEEDVAAAMNEALACLNRGDGVAYAQFIDGYNEADSLLGAFYTLAVTQLHTEDCVLHGGQTHSFVSSVVVHDDSTATAYYISRYADGDSIECAQRLVHRQGTWRLARTTPPAHNKTK